MIIISLTRSTNSSSSRAHTTVNCPVGHQQNF